MERQMICEPSTRTSVSNRMRAVAIAIVLLQATPIHPVVQADTALLRSVLRAMPRSALPVRVDPRLLVADPALVTVGPLADMVAEVSGTPAPRSLFAPLDSASLRKLADVINAEGLQVTSFVDNHLCAVARFRKELREGCGKESYQSIAIALPRDGGVHWPGNFDERTRYPGRSVVTVRVLSRDLLEDGSPGDASDFVFEKTSGGWRLLERRLLLVLH